MRNDPGVRDGWINSAASASGVGGRSPALPLAGGATVPASGTGASCRLWRARRTGCSYRRIYGMARCIRPSHAAASTGSGSIQTPSGRQAVILCRTATDDSIPCGSDDVPQQKGPESGGGGALGRVIIIRRPGPRRHKRASWLAIFCGGHHWRGRYQVKGIPVGRQVAGSIDVHHVAMPSTQFGLGELVTDTDKFSIARLGSRGFELVCGGLSGVSDWEMARSSRGCGIVFDERSGVRPGCHRH